MKKRLLSIMSLVIAGILTLTACGSPAAPPASSSAASKAPAVSSPAAAPAASSPAAPAASSSDTKAKPTTLKLGHIFAQDGSANLATKKFADLVKEKTNGAYQIEIYPNSQLGDERELCEAVTMGTVDMTLCGDSFVNWYVPEYGALCGFFTWKSFDHAKKAYRGEVGAELTKAYSDKGKSTVLDYWMRAPRYVITKKEVHNLNDFKGYTLRIPDDTYYAACFKGLGANPTPIAFDEAYMALKQGTVNGLEQPLEDAYNNSFYDNTKYVLETAHQISMFGLLINNNALAKLPQDVQKTLKDCAIQAGDYQNQLMEAAESKYRDLLKGKGMTFIALDDIQRWRDIVNNEVNPKFAGTWKKGLLEKAISLGN